MMLEELLRRNYGETTIVACGSSLLSSLPKVVGKVGNWDGLFTLTISCFVG
jgi:hypothetical protein